MIMIIMIKKPTRNQKEKKATRQYENNIKRNPQENQKEKRCFSAQVGAGAGAGGVTYDIIPSTAYAWPGAEADNTVIIEIIPSTAY